MNAAVRARLVERVLARAGEPGGRYAVWALLERLRATTELPSLAPAIAARVGSAAIDVFFVRDDLDARGRAERVLLDAADAGELDVVNDLLPAFVFFGGAISSVPTHALAERFRAAAPPALRAHVFELVDYLVRRVADWESEFTPAPWLDGEVLRALVDAKLDGFDATRFGRAVAFHAPQCARELVALGALTAVEAYERERIGETAEGPLRLRGGELAGAAPALELFDELWVYGDDVGRFPPEGAAVPYLRTLTFEHVRSSLPALRAAELPALEGLQILSCRELAPPAWIGDLDGLSSLRFAGSESRGPAPSIPRELGRLARLRTLTLSGNFTALPDALAALAALRTLKVSSFHLAAWPAALCALPALEELELSSHVLRALPEELVGLRALRRLRIAPLHASEPPPVLHRMPWLERLAIWSAVRYPQPALAALAAALPATELSITYTANAR